MIALGAFFLGLGCCSLVSQPQTQNGDRAAARDFQQRRLKKSPSIGGVLARRDGQATSYQFPDLGNPVKSRSRFP